METEMTREQLGVLVWSLFLRTHAAVVPRIEQDLLRRRQLPLAWYDVLLELNAAAGRRLRMQELGNRVVRRDPDPSDRRGSFAVLTDSGRHALRAAAPVYLTGIGEHFTAALTDEELPVLQAALDRVLAELND